MFLSLNKLPGSYAKYVPGYSFRHVGYLWDSDGTIEYGHMNDAISNCNDNDKCIGVWVNSKNSSYKPVETLIFEPSTDPATFYKKI